MPTSSHDVTRPGERDVMPSKDLMLYLAGLLGLVASGVAALQSPSLAAVATFVGAITALVSNYVWFSEGPLSSAELNNKPVDEIREIAKKQGIEKYSTLSKRRLVQLLHDEKGALRRRRWAPWKWALLLCGILAIPLINSL